MINQIECAAIILTKIWEIMSKKLTSFLKPQVATWTLTRPKKSRPWYCLENQATVYLWTLSPANKRVDQSFANLEIFNETKYVDQTLLHQSINQTKHIKNGFPYQELKPSLLDWTTSSATLLKPQQSEREHAQSVGVGIVNLTFTHGSLRSYNYAQKDYISH